MENIPDRGNFRRRNRRFLFIFGSLFEDRNYVIAAISAISGGTISVVPAQEAAVAAGLMSVAVLPVLIAGFKASSDSLSVPCCFARKRSGSRQSTVPGGCPAKARKKKGD